MSDANTLFIPQQDGIDEAAMTQAALAGWHHTAYQEKQVVLVSPRKVHLLVTYSRNRADGSIITEHRNVWIVTWQDGHWGIKQRSY
jgi:hypothetical protein